jgi:hypothetical protein
MLCYTCRNVPLADANIRSTVSQGYPDELRASSTSARQTASTDLGSGAPPFSIPVMRTHVTDPAPQPRLSGCSGSLLQHD